MPGSVRRLLTNAMRLAAVLVGIAFLSAEGYYHAITGKLHGDLLIVGIAFPVIVLWIARVLSREPTE